jgi:hypothetical protein
MAVHPAQDLEAHIVPLTRQADDIITGMIPLTAHGIHFTQALIC